MRRIRASERVGLTCQREFLHAGVTLVCWSALNTNGVVANMKAEACPVVAAMVAFKSVCLACSVWKLSAGINREAWVVGKPDG